MSHDLYFTVYVARPAELPSTFRSYDELSEFTAEREVLLQGSTRNGEMFSTLDQCAARFKLAALGLLDIGKPDEELPEFEQTSRGLVQSGFSLTKRLHAAELDHIFRDIDTLIGIARTSPKSLILNEYTFPELMKGEVEQVLEAANGATDDPDLMYKFADGENWWCFFTYLHTLRNICARAKIEGMTVLHIASFG